MTVQYEVLFDVIAGVSCLGAVLMAWLGYRRWDAARKERRAEFLLKLLEKFRDDPEFQEFVYAVDYGKDVKSKREGLKDRVLSYMSYVCYLKKTGVISEDEFGFFEYEVTRSLRNTDVHAYMKFIADFAIQNNCKSPFCTLDEYAESLS